MPMPEGMVVTPLRGMVFIELVPFKDDRAEKLGLVSVDVKRHWDRPTRDAVVLSVGPWVNEIKVGDMVVVKGSAGKTIDEGGLDGSGNYRFIKQSEVLAIYEGTATAQEA